MVKRAYVVILLLVGACSFLFSGCQPVRPISCGPNNTFEQGPLDVENLKGHMLSGLYAQKIKNLILVMDDTTSMDECLNGVSKRQRAHTMMTRIVQTIPDIELHRGIRIYGPYVDDKQYDISLSHGRGMSPSSELREKVLTKTVPESTFNPLADALEGAYHELKLVEGRTAILLLSDFTDPKKEMLRSAQYIRDYYQGAVCVYPLVIGEDGLGRNSAEDVVEIAGCGMSALADSLDSGKNLADFMEKVLFDKLEPPSPMAPIVEQPKEKGLSYSQLLKERKLTVELKTEFDFDKSNIRPQYKAHLKEIARFMKKYPDTTATIEGHTCSIGTQAYNMKLSQRRARSVKKHLVALGVEKERLSLAFFGETQPIADNTTVEGRRKNRRAVAVITTTVTEPAKSTDSH